MLKGHFEGIQTALVKEVKEMKETFEQIEAEVEQNAVDKQCANIERKNLLIENENLIADCMSNELLYSVMNDCVTMPAVKPKVVAHSIYAINVKAIPPCNRDNREVHLDNLKHLKERVETHREIVEEARKPLDNVLENACFYTKRS
nr:hypothetical protein [Tanacetum cinerariifolium]